jgi:hypothetical protein
LLEAQAEVETGALLEAKSVEELNYLRGRISALLFIAELPQRVATTYQESFNRDDAKRADATRPADITSHWGSPHFTDLWDRSPADRHTAFGHSGLASVEPSGSHLAG